MKKLLGILMYMGNNEGVKEPWYSLKQKLCARYGVNNGYDLQYLEGKQCWGCDGTGKFTRYSFGSGYKEDCYRCNGGWYTMPAYVVLERIKIGDKVFHKPISRTESRDSIHNRGIPLSITIHGYIAHHKVKYGWLAFSILFLVFARKEYLAYIKTFGAGWRISWWLPKNWLRNFMHIKHRKMQSHPIVGMREYFRKRIDICRQMFVDDLPF